MNRNLCVDCHRPALPYSEYCACTDMQIREPPKIRAHPPSVASYWKRGRRMRWTWGRCPHCGEAVMVEVTEGKPGKIMEHGCEARACEYADCSVIELKKEMVRVASGAWYCPVHALLLAAKDLVMLYRVDGEADWTRISEILAEELPQLVPKAEAFLSSLR